MSLTEQVRSKTPSLADVREFRKLMINWFDQNGREFPWRKKSATNYQLIIAEILLQRTQANTVAYFFPVFIKRFPSWKRLGMATKDELEHILQPIGLWRRKAESILKLANEMVQRRGRFPKGRNEIEALPGVGQYIANAVLMFCHNEPQPLLDSSMARVLERSFGPRDLVDIRYDPYLQNLSKLVVACGFPVRINWAILDLASLICMNKLPKCDYCPILKKCLFRNFEIL